MTHDEKMESKPPAQPVDLSVAQLEARADSLAKQIRSLMGYQPAPPPSLRLHIDGNKATPIFAAMLARVLTDAGATVTFSNRDISVVEKTPNLAGLHVHIDRLTWVRDEEAEQWGAK